jgi:ubiquinone/menaquinone biosynthesis C-methylase UbiE
MRAKDIREQYDKAAEGYDWKVTILERITGADHLRRCLLAKATGDVLDVACGTGRNFPYYPGECRVTGIDLSPAMLEQAREKAFQLGISVSLRPMDVEKLEWPTQSFDTVVSSLALCTFPDPSAAITEMARICKPGGQLLFLEHGRSHWPVLAWLQDRSVSRMAKACGCRSNREPLNLVRDAGLVIHHHRREFMGILHVIEASPR